MPTQGKSAGQMFQDLKTLTQRRLRTVDSQNFGLELISLHFLGLGEKII